LKKEHARTLKHSETEQKTQNEAYKYKLQYLELSSKEIEKDKKRWQDKEREYEKALVALTAELRELKLEHQQAIDLHEAFRAQMDAKESARTLETSSFEIKKQSLQAEHQLTLRQSQAASNSKISSLEREIAKVKNELDDAREENERLTLALESGSGVPDDVKAQRDRSYLYADLEEKPVRSQRQPRSTPASTTTTEPEPVSASPSESTPASSSEIDLNLSASIGGHEVGAEVEVQL